MQKSTTMVVPPATRGLGAPLEIIGRNRAHEEQFHMSVWIDTAGENVATVGIDDFAARRRRYLSPMAAILSSSISTSARRDGHD